MITSMLAKSKMLVAASFILTSAFVAHADESAAQEEALPVIAFWQFDENAPYADSSGNNLDLNSHTRPVMFKNGYAKFIPNTSGFLGRTNLGLSSYSALTVEFFVRMPDFTKEYMIFFTHFGWNQSAGFFGLHGGTPCGYVHDTLNAVWVKDVVNKANVEEKDIIDSSILGDHGWHHVAVVMDASSDDETVFDEMKVYVDGELKTSSMASPTHHASAFKNTNFMLGSTQDGNGTVYLQLYASRAISFVGDMDDVRITGKALTPEEFLQSPTISESETSEEYVSWTGEGESSNWNDPSNWSSASVPEQGAKVHIPPTAYVTLDEETPTAGLAAIKVDGTVVFASSNNCLRADDVYVSSSGRLQGSCPFTGIADISNRIWIVCKNLTVDEGGMINADGRGFCGGSDKVVGRGPGGTMNDQESRASAASHGGYSTTSPLGGCEYGNPVYPETAGSGGYAWTADMGAGNGGGVIRIDASGTVTVNGSVSANAQNLMEYTEYGRASAGAGGSILIFCSKITGTGNISAKGGNSTGAEKANNSNNRKSAAGAGGRIAVHYDPESQTADEFKNLVFEVQAGKLRSANTYSYEEVGLLMYASAGTLWLTDTSVITSENISNLRGRLVNAENLVFDGDVTITNWVGIASDGASIKVGGNLVVSGPDARFEIGSVTQTVSNIQRKGFVSSAASRLEVAGDMIVTNSARFDIYCASTNSTQPNGAYVAVAGDFVLATNTFTYPVSHPQNGGSAIFNVGKFVLLEGATLGMVGGGFSGGRGKDGYGPGKGSGYCGAGYGGLGGYVDESETTTCGQIYGNPLRPLWAGSGGGHAWSGQTGGGPGGGSIHIVASNSMYIAGSLIADGSEPVAYNNGSSGGSGGSILLETLQFECAPTAIFSAKGGDSGGVNMNTERYTSGGGGGRIAVWTSSKFFYFDGIEKDRIEASSTIPDALVDMFDVTGGLATAPANSFAGDNGTVWFVNLLSPRGFSVIIR